jgi:hypothetical protein
LLLESKNAVIYGGGRAISGGARTFVRKGAYIFLAGRTRENLEAVAAERVPETLSPGKFASVDSNLQMDDAAFQGLLDRLDEMRMLRRPPRLAQAAAITGTFVSVTGEMFTS